MVERTLPLVPDRLAGITLASLRGTLRAPEAKIMFISPVIVLGLFAMLLSGSSNLARLQVFAPMMSLGAISLGLFSILQLIQNQFGLDRDGFRGYVLSPVPRHEILAAKNAGSPASIDDPNSEGDPPGEIDGEAAGEARAEGRHQDVD